MTRTTLVRPRLSLISPRRRRAGFTIAELLISMTVALVVITAGANFAVRSLQTRRGWTVRESVDRNARFVGMSLARDAQEPRQLLHVALLQRHRRDAAAIRARRAVDRLFDILGDATQPPLDVIVRLEMAPQREVLVALLVAQAAYLDQVGDHVPA